MNKSVRYGTITFNPDFLFGTDEEGSTVKFSKAERFLLIKLTDNSGVVLSRDRLLDAISGPGSDVVDRNIDFMINRLRRKLGDSARKPVYIETRYAEGYVWIARCIETAPRSSGAFLVIGPLKGARYSGGFADQARSYAEKLRSSLRRNLAKESRTVIDEDCPAASDFVGDKPKFAAELSFLAIDGRLDCAITLRAFATGQILRVSRYTVADAEGRLDSSIAKKAAKEISDAIWDALAYRTSVPVSPSDEPLAVRMHDAAILLAEAESWVEAERRLKAQLESQANDYNSQIMLATCLHSKYLLSGMILPYQDFRAQDEDEIERLVLSSLPHLQDNPVFMMAAGKLLYFLDRGHRPLAVEIVEQAFKSTTAFATSFAILGQIRMLQGDMVDALTLIDQGLELCQDMTAFQRYLLVLKCQVLLTMEDNAALAVAAETLYAKTTGAREGLSIFFTSTEPGEITPEAQFLVDHVDEARARAMLVWANYLWGRHFESVEHRRNLMRPALTLFVRRFGTDIIPHEVKASLAIAPSREFQAVN